MGPAGFALPCIVLIPRIVTVRQLRSMSRCFAVADGALVGFRCWVFLMMFTVGDNPPLRRFFAGLVENAFCGEVGMCDPEVTGYVADMLVAFTHMDRLNAVRELRGKRLTEIAPMLAVLRDDKPMTQIERDRAVYRHIGDYVLFWAGVYPEQLKRTARGRSDVLVDYVAEGKKSYAIACDLASEDTEPPSRVFRHLSDDFESCVYGLGIVRRDLERPAAGRGVADHDLLY